MKIKCNSFSWCILREWNSFRETNSVGAIFVIKCSLDTLSQAPVPPNFNCQSRVYIRIDAYVDSSIPATDIMLQLKSSPPKLAILHVRSCLSTAKPGKPGNQISSTIKPYLSVSTELSIQDGLLMRDSGIVIPKSLQDDILQKIHSGHQGITKCRVIAVWCLELANKLKTFWRIVLLAVKHKCDQACENQAYVRICT